MAIYGALMTNTRGLDDGDLDTAYYLMLYTQPRLRHLRARFYHHIWEPLSWRVIHALGRWAQRRHQAHCQDGCVEATDGDGDGGSVRMCGYIPWINRQDLRCYDWQSAGSQVVTEIPLSDEQAETLGYELTLKDLRLGQ